MLDKFITELQQELQIEGSLAGETPDTFNIPLGEDTSVILSPLPAGFSLTCNVIEAPKEREDIFLENALRANLFGQGTEGAILGLSEDGTHVTLIKSVDSPIDYKTFKEIVEDFLNSVEFWRGEVLTHNIGDTALKTKAKQT